MFIIPAIDLQDGQCVRLREGKLSEKTVYSTDPGVIARQWAGLGAKRLHVVDLDGAFSGLHKNILALKEIMRQVDIPIQYGGGVRELESIRGLLEMGVERVILGTAAAEDPGLVEKACSLFPERIAVGVDVKNDKVVIKGWVEDSPWTTADFVKEMERKGVRRFIFTDVGRDGTLKGPNFAAIDSFLSYTDSKVIASGGVSNLDDVKELRKRKSRGLEGVIVGKALYDGRIDLAQYKESE